MSAQPLEVIESSPVHEIAKLADGREVVVNEEGWCIDPDTGEPIGHKDELLHDQDADIAVLLERRANAVARKAGHEAARKALMDGIAKRYDTKIERENRLVDWFDRFALPQHIPHVRALAQKQKGKQKFVDYPMGRIQFTKLAPKFHYLPADPEKANAFVLDRCPKAVKVTIDLSPIAEVPEAMAKVAAALKEILTIPAMQSCAKVDLKTGQMDDLEGLVPVLSAKMLESLENPSDIEVAYEALAKIANEQEVAEFVGIVKTEGDDWGNWRVSQ